MLNFYPRLCTLNPFRSGSEVGYHVTEPCRSCLKACNNGHFWMYVPNTSPYTVTILPHTLHFFALSPASLQVHPPLAAQTACHPRSYARSLPRDFTQRRGANERALVGCCLAARRFHGTEVIARERVSFSSELSRSPSARHPPPHIHTTLPSVMAPRTCLHCIAAVTRGDSQQLWQVAMCVALPPQGTAPSC
jgi:hypothetical protein